MDPQDILDRSKRRDERIAAALQLLQKKDEASLEALIQALLTDPSPVVRHECAFILGESGEPWLGRYLIQAIENDKSLIVQHVALEVLDYLKDPAYAPFLGKYLAHPKPDLRDTAEIALEIIKNQKKEVMNYQLSLP